MDWDDLRFFAELARTGSLSAAARTLRVDHSTVARRIASLEGALGIRLFDRLPRGYELTPEGEHVREQVERLEEDVFALQRVAQGRGSGLSGTVRVSAPPAFASLFLSPRLGLLRQRHPDIVLELDERFVCMERESVPSRDIWLVVHEDVRRSPRVRAVMDILIEILGRERALLEGNEA